MLLYLWAKVSTITCRNSGNAFDVGKMVHLPLARQPYSSSAKPHFHGLADRAVDDEFLLPQLPLTLRQHFKFRSLIYAATTCGQRNYGIQNSHSSHQSHPSHRYNHAANAANSASLAVFWKGRITKRIRSKAQPAKG